MKHKVTIWSWNRPPKGRWWYVTCHHCGDNWVWPEPHEPNGTPYYGRRTWKAAFNLGIDHQISNHETVRDRYGRFATKRAG